MDSGCGGNILLWDCAREKKRIGTRGIMNPNRVPTVNQMRLERIVLRVHPTLCDRRSSTASTLSMPAEMSSCETV